ncbi:Serrate RNA effector molecule [Hibiscus syriacus]|uniref:Serrate RNA effector molecule n=1 Tax=Hibiscus syriacus TaxID=106335 RepID=A0A6A3CLX3_HIBSY|nr:Serrate RNA effector molecule [Hibiscus syriacus]
MPFYFSLSNDIASADWDAGLGGSGNTSSSRCTQREGLMSYKQFIQELEDDILPTEADRRLKDKYHPTNLVTVIERSIELARKVAKEFLLDLHSGTLDLSPGVNPSVSSKPGQASDPNSEDEADIEFVHKHLKLKHPELVTDLTSKVREELYYQNYMNDPDAPGGTPVMQQSLPKDKPPRQKMLENRLKDERGLRGARDNRENGSDRYENPQSSNFPSNNDGTDEGNRDDSMFDAFGGRGMHVGAPFSSDTAPLPVLMPVPGSGPLKPFVPAPPELAIQVFRERGGPPFEGNSRGGRPGPNVSVIGREGTPIVLLLCLRCLVFPPTKPYCRSPDQTNQSRTDIESNGDDYRSHARNKTRSKRATKIDEDT